MLTALDYAKQQFLWDMAVNQNKPLAADLLSFLNSNEYSLPNIRFVNWAIDYLYNNPSTDYNAFKAQYLQQPAATVAKISSLSIILDATIDEQVWMYRNLAKLNMLTSYLQQNGATLQNKDFLIWAVDYLMANPNITLQTFTNQFLSAPEGIDGGEEFDPSFWANPSLNIISQSLPTYQNFAAAYPSHSNPLYDSPELYLFIGGMPNSIYQANPTINFNTCALRLSRALNYSGVTIPNISGKTFKGDDNLYYFLGASNMLAWMKLTFGIPTGNNHITNAQGGVNGRNFPSLLSGKKGIYGLISNNTSAATGFGATGHMDLINSSVCDGGCYFSAKGGVKEIFIWELP